jgi:PAS domain S-box-containing protein
LNSEAPDPLARRWLAGGGAALLTLAGLVLAGRFGGWPHLVTLVPGGVPMAFPTTVGFFGTGFAMAAHAAGHGGPARIGGLLLAVFGIGTLVLYAAAEPLGLTALVYDPADPTRSRGTGFDGRMSPFAALSFALAGFALWHLGAARVRTVVLGPLLALLLALPLVAMLSYATGLHAAAAWWRFTALAVHTALAFVLLGAVLLLWLVRRVAGTQRTVTLTLPFFVVAGAALLALGGLVLVSNEQRQEAARLEIRSRDIQSGIERFAAGIPQFEAATRAFALTGEAADTGLIAQRRAGIATALERLSELTRQDPPQHARVRDLRPLVAEILAANDALVQAKRDRGTAAAARELQAERPGIMAGLRAITDEMTAEEQRKLRSRRADTLTHERRLRWVLLAGAGATITLVAAAFGLVHRAQRELESANRRLEDRFAELATSESRFRQAFHFAGTGMAMVGLDGRWIRVNRSLCELTGYSESELLVRTFQEITHPDDLAADLAQLGQLVAGRRRFYQMEKRYFHREGHIVWVKLTVSVVRDAAQRPLHFVSQIEDITEHKNLQENLARARDEAVEASRLKSEFLATMSHEIRTPMNAVIGMTALLRDTPLTPVQADYVRTVETSGESLLTIINDILDYSKIEAGRIDLESVPFELRPWVQDAIDLFAGRAQEKHLRLACEIGPDVPARVAGDATRLRQVLVNLLGNAVKFTDAGAVTVTVTAAPAAPATSLRHLHFAVRDTGIGIAPEGLSRLFKSFSQVDASTTRRFGGTGLGLAISKRLVELMGGTIAVESRPGEGSVFRFEVSLEALPDLPPGAAPVAAAAEFDGTLGLRCPLRLLVAEDNPVNQRVASLLLQKLGYRAATAANGEEALAALKLAAYDAILMDVEMPVLDGCETTRRIRAAHPSAARPWIIALTAGAMRSDRERALAAGMNDFLTKPVHRAALAAALARAHAALHAAGTFPA